MNIIKHLIGLILTRNCCVCGDVLMDFEDHICEGCYADLKEANYQEGNFLEWKLKNSFIIHSAFTGYLYFKKTAIAKVVHSFKYGNLPDLAVHLGRELGRKAKERGFDKDYDYLVPVPLHPKKKRNRGYNQSERICAGIAEITGLETREDVLKRVNNTSSQTEKTAEERWSEIQGDYKLNVDPESFRGKRIVLVDDIFTTGSTIETCYNELRKIPKVRIGVITVGQAFS